MAEYDIAFGERLAKTARMVAGEGLVELDAQRTVLYLSLLSTEITLKAILERAGKPVSEIRAHSHRLAGLLADLSDQCEVEVEVAPGTKRHVPASRIRAIQLSHGGAQTTVGAVIDTESQGESPYPNRVRYGDVLRHFPAEVVTQMAEKVSAFAHEHWDSIRIN